MKDWLADRVSTGMSSNAVRRTRTWLGIGRGAPAKHELHNVAVPAEVIVYFGDLASKTYQLGQWLPVLERLNEKHKVLLVFRKLGALRTMRRSTRLPKIFVRNFIDLSQLYDDNDYRLSLYVNNGVNNFQSLSHARMVHVHINHGESDKLSMVSNQAKAYDKVMIAGPAAQERHRAVLVDFDESKLVTVGRPQLDIDFEPELEEYTGRTVMYAPTWEGENDANNYTSLDLYGVQIVESILATDARLVYKPHPRVVGSKDPEVSAAHTAVVERITDANNDGGQHLISEGGNILAMFSQVDALITDVSSVGLDFLYLHPERPLAITDRRNDSALLERDAPISRACPIINEASVANIDQLLRELFDPCESSIKRVEMRRFYFGDLAKGESTERFLQCVSELIDGRSAKLEGMDFHQSSLESVED